MTVRRLASISLLIFVNVLAGFFYLQSRHPFQFSIKIENETLFWNSSECFNCLQQPVAAVNFSKTEEEKSQTEDSIQPIFPHPYQYVIVNSDLCTRVSAVKGKLSLLVLVCSAVPNLHSRQTIRETWGSIASASNNTGSMRLGFLLGATKNATLQQMIRKESLEHSDIIQENFCDSYQNLTLKSVMLLKWVTEHCPNVHFVLKTDDDMYVNLGKLANTVTRLPVRTKVMYGYLFRKARPNRNPSAKWFVPKQQFQAEVFPDYLSGTGYIISRDAIPTLFEVSTTLPFLVMEDVFITGLCASEAGVRRYNLKGFAYWKRSASGCAFKDSITGHHVTVKDMKKIWKELKNPKLSCRSARKSS